MQSFDVYRKPLTKQRWFLISQEIVVAERFSLLAIKEKDISWARYFSIIARSVKVRCLLIGLLLSGQTAYEYYPIKNKICKSKRTIVRVKVGNFWR